MDFNIKEKIVRIPTERIWFFQDQVVKTGYIVGAIFNKPDHPHKHSAYHVVLDDGSKTTIPAKWAKRGDPTPPKPEEEPDTMPVPAPAPKAKAEEPKVIQKEKPFTQRISIDSDLEQKMRDLASKSSKRSK